MAGEPTMATESGTDREGPLAWFDRSLLAVVLGSLAITAVAGLVQFRYGSYEMTFAEAFWAVFNPKVIFDVRVWAHFLLGGVLDPSALLNPAQWDAILVSAHQPELNTESLIVWNIRLPRVVVAVLVGMNLAVSGAIFQAVTRNELASPYILGVSSGAGLAILVTLVLFSGLAVFLPIVAALGGSLAFLLVYAIAWQNGTSPIRLVLAGVIVSTVFQSLQTGLFFFAQDVGVVQSAIAWTTGSLTGTDWEQVRMTLPWTVLAMGLALVSARQLNVLLLGEQTASSLGMNVERVRFALSGVAVLAASASIAVAGIVGFVGLVVPHVVRNIVGSDYKRIVVGCLFAGPALLVVADAGARLGMQLLVGSAGQVPVGIVTGLVGGPYFLYLMRRQDHIGEL
ncbi:FecCD family ABC transporter permease [Salinibaculum rarum]|uniref:FecCD family ABC transporter permease n=1 Tax=Salinibaculum rarum TaxID=3058903 RepID=UPI00265FD599|nr:iron ABC transporter permease [Salinibaculum sp. KK48]